MQILSTYIVVLFFFTFLASGGPIPGNEPIPGTEPQAKQGLQTPKPRPHEYGVQEVSIFSA
jgi:hypothetical protein